MGLEQGEETEEAKTDVRVIPEGFDGHAELRRLLFSGTEEFEKTEKRDPIVMDPESQKIFNFLTHKTSTIISIGRGQRPSNIRPATDDS